MSPRGHSRAGKIAPWPRGELREELGIDVDFGRIDPVLCANFPNGFDDYYVIDRNLDIDGLKLQESEVARVRWVTRAEILAMVDSGSFSLSQIVFRFSIRHPRKRTGFYTQIRNPREPAVPADFFKNE